MDAETEVSKLNFKIQDSAFLTFHFYDLTDNNMNLMKCFKKTLGNFWIPSRTFTCFMLEELWREITCSNQKKYERK